MKKIFSVLYRDREIFPRYAFGETQECFPFKELEPILHFFGDRKSNWGVGILVYGAQRVSRRETTSGLIVFAPRSGA